MDPNSEKSTVSNLAFGNIMATAARDYQKELLAQQKAQTSASINQEVDLDELIDIGLRLSRLESRVLSREPICGLLLRFG
ncbi:hypothetical protein F0562_006367 [Nyssa sinensis]|uniref:Uncharacterized protein n=1 Tax=Nyssa sinensis TaxID=561372 RepID=A0A5J5AQ54_9ASTE|nr:hypothetical protein F0562_006367 [Nyssa sinensis]